MATKQQQDALRDAIRNKADKATIDRLTNDAMRSSSGSGETAAGTKYTNDNRGSGGGYVPPTQTSIGVQPASKVANPAGDLEKLWASNAEKFYNSTVKGNSNAAVQAMWDRYQNTVKDSGSYYAAIQSGMLPATAKADYRGYVPGDNGDLAMREYSFDWRTGKETGNVLLNTPGYNLLKDQNYKNAGKASTEYAKQVFSEEYQKLTKSGQMQDTPENKAWYMSQIPEWLEKNKYAKGNVQTSNTGTTMVDGNVKANSNMSVQDSNTIKYLQDAYKIAKTDEEKIALNQQANAIRDKYGIAHVGSGVAGTPEVKNAMVSAISSSLGTTPDALATPEASALLDQLAEIAANKRDMTINNIASDEKSAIAEQNSLMTEANNAYTDEQKQLGEAQYASAEQMKSSAINRGIGNSQQIVGLEQGISNKYAGMRFTSAENRELRLNAIKDKVAMIKQKADAAMSNADLQYSNDLLTAQAEQAKTQQDFQLKASLQNMQNSFVAGENEKDREAKIDMFNATFEQDLVKMGLEQKQKKEIMALDQTNKIALSKMEYSQRVALARNANDTSTLKLGNVLEALKTKTAQGVTPAKIYEQTGQTLNSALSSLSDPKRVEQLKKTGTIEGISPLELEVYKKVVGKDLINDLKYMVKTKSTSIGESGKASDSKGANQGTTSYIPTSNIVLLMKNFDTKYYNKNNEASSYIDELVNAQVLYGNKSISLEEAEAMLK